MSEAPPRIAWLAAHDPPESFPPVNAACREPDGLLAAGGDLSTARLLYAYRHGIFPWYDQGQPILWWSPDPRCILRPDGFHVARRFRRDVRSSGFEVSFNLAFREVMRGCATAPRFGQLGTWITPEMLGAYTALHDDGWAHSIEVWHGDELAGGMYGIAIGRVFFGESMFTRVTNASKAAMLALCRHLEQAGFGLLDCQVVSPHLLTLGAMTLPREAFRNELEQACRPATRATDWPAGKRPAADFLPE